MSNKLDSVLYVGVCNNLKKRTWEHKNKVNPDSFTAKYNLDKLVYFEVFQFIEDAIRREKQIKKWNRKKKEALVDTVNLERKDLSEGWL